MNRLQKILLIGAGGIVVLIAGLVLFVKFYLTDEKLLSIVEPVLEEQLGRDISIGGFDLQLFRSLPDASIGIRDMAVHSPERGGSPSPDLASVQRVWVEVPLFPLLKNKIHVKALHLDAPRVLVEVYDDLSTNLIELGENADTTTEYSDETSASALQEIAIEEIRIRDGQIGYVHADGTLLTVAGLDTDLSARLAETAMLSGQVSVDDVFYETGGISYANHWAMALDVNAEAHLDSAWLRIDQAELTIQDLLLAVKGGVRNFNSEKITVDLAFDAPSAPVSSFWSLLPSTITKDMEGIQSQGFFEVEATLNGLLTEGELPALNANLSVRDGIISYPNLPSSIQGLNLDMNLTNEVLSIEQLQAQAEGTKIELAARISEFASPVLQGTLELEADLSQIEGYYPLEDSTVLSGTLLANAQFDGPLSEADNIAAQGLITFQNITYESTLIEQPIKDLNGQVRLDNEQIVFDAISLQTGQSDIQFEGLLSGYKGLLEDPLTEKYEEPVFKGSITSDYLNVTEQVSEDTTSSFVGPLELPPLEVDVTLFASTFEFNGYTLKEARGAFTMNERAMGFEDITANFMSGQLEASGDFDLQNPLSPVFNGAVSLKQLPVSEFFAAFPQMDSIVQLGNYLDGLFDSEASFGLTLDKDLQPDYASLRANGLFGAKQGSFGTMPLQTALSEYTGLSNLERLSVNEWSHAFRISGEKMHVQDLAFTAGEYGFNVNGSQSFDGGLDYQLRVELPESASETIQNAPVHSSLGPVINVVNTSLTNPETGRITLDLLTRGTFADPEVTLNAEMMRARLSGQASALAAGARAEAQARMDSLEQAARERADAEIEEQRQALEERATEEADRLLGGLLDSTGAALDVDSLKDQGADALKNRLNGLFNRKKRNN